MNEKYLYFPLLKIDTLSGNWHERIMQIKKEWSYDFMHSACTDALICSVIVPKFGSISRGLDQKLYPPGLAVKQWVLIIIWCLLQ